MNRAASVPITLRAVAKAYGKTLALDHVDLDVHSGEFLTLLGPSGSGKTTLLMVLAGFIRPDQGSLRFGDKEVIRLAPHKRDVGMVFQNYALFPHLDVAANIAFPLKLRGVAAAETAQRVAAVLEMVKLGGFGSRRVHELSGGQRQRVALARAIVFEPRIVLMDEPLSALDKQLREFMQIELRQLHDKLGMTTIYVTHDQREALTMSDRIAVINGGRVQQIDAPRAIYEKPANRFVAEFIGESSFLAVETDGGVCRCAGEPLQVAALPAASQRALLMLRPERVRVGDGERRDGHNVLDARITDIIYQGDTVLVQAVRPTAAASARAASPRRAGSVACRRSATSRPSASARRTRCWSRTTCTSPMAALAHPAGAHDEAPNARALRRDQLRERLALLGLGAPALLLVTLTMVLPIGWLFGLSFIADDGSLSLVHYRRLVEQPSYARIFGATFKVSLITTAICILLGYPLAYVLSQLSRRAANLCLIAVMLPFWTSLLVRTYAWLVLLQRQGLINTWGMELGLWEAPLPLVHNLRAP